MNLAILDQKGCTVPETSEHIKYLEGTPVSQVAILLRNGSPLYKGVIKSREILGSIPTIYSELRGIYCSKEYSREKFLVKEVLPTLKDPRCSDNQSLDSIEYFMKLVAEDLMKVTKITILEQARNCLVVDGNKRASAWYERTSAYKFPEIPLYLVKG